MASIRANGGLWGRRRRSQRGAMVVEAAICTPVFLFIIVGVMEFGLALKDYLAMSSGTRAAVRTASTVGNSSTADHAILAALRNGTRAISESSGSIDTIVIYRASGPTDLLSSVDSCLAGSVAGRCNRYVGADLSRPVSQFGCAASSPDRFWCPTSRLVAQSDPPDYVGIHVVVTHINPTGVFGERRTFSDTYVMRIEPQRL